MANPYPTDKSDVRELVRGLTLYEDDADEIPQSTLDTQIQLAQMKLKTLTADSDWYTNEDLGQALVGTTAILSKCAIENYSVSSWDMGAASIDVSGAGDDEQMQFQQWADLVAEGLANGGYTSGRGGTSTNINSASYMN
jgi:hypothetical protein